MDTWKLLVLVLALLVAGPGRVSAGDRQDAAREVPSALAEVDSLLADGRTGPALGRLARLAARFGDDPVYGWQIDDRQGVALLRAGDAQAALPLLEATVARRPLDPVAHRNLAAGLRLLGRRGRALAEYTQTVELDPRNPVHRLEYAQYLAEFSQWAAAEREFRLAAHYCHCVEAEQGLALALLRLGRPDEAVPVLKGLYEADPTTVRRRNLVGALQAAARDSELVELLAPQPTPDLSADELLALVQAEGSAPPPHRSLAFAVDLSHAAPPSQVASAPRFWGRVAVNLLEAGHLGEGLVAADRSVELAPDNIVYRNNRAALLVRLGREEEAARDLAEIRRRSGDPAPKE